MRAPRCPTCRERDWVQDGDRVVCRTCRRITRALLRRRFRKANGDGSRQQIQDLRERIRHEQRVERYEELARLLGLHRRNAEEPSIPAPGIAELDRMLREGEVSRARIDRDVDTPGA